MEKIGAKTIGGGSSNKLPGGGSASGRPDCDEKRPTTVGPSADEGMIGAGSGD